MINFTKKELFSISCQALLAVCPDLDTTSIGQRVSEQLALMIPPGQYSVERVSWKGYCMLLSDVIEARQFSLPGVRDNMWFLTTRKTLNLFLEDLCIANGANTLLAQETAERLTDAVDPPIGSSNLQW